MAQTKLYATYMGLYRASKKHRSKWHLMAVDAVFKLVAHKDQRSGHVYHTGLLRKAYYNSQ